jgi:hypothetical protein
MVAAALAPATGRAAIVVDDTFDGTGATRADDAADPADLGFYAFTPGASLQVVSEDGTGYLLASAPSNSLFGTAALPAVTLAHVGDRLTFRCLVQAVVTGAPPQPMAEFRIGIYNSGGTASTDDSAASRAAAADDKGCRLNLLDDPGLFYSGTFGRDVSGESMTDYEGGNYIGALRFADGQWHSVEIELLLNSVGVSARVLYDGDERVNNPFFNLGVNTFDNIQFGTGTAPLDVRLDDVRVTFTPVPEPTGVAAVAGLGAAGLFGRRRRG